MPSSQANSVLQYVRKVAGATAVLDRADQELLDSFLNQRDQTAFGVLVRRYGPLVLGVCRRVLHHEQDAEDAFQATFLVLSRQAPGLCPRKSLAGWLYSVAYRTAQKARREAARRRRYEDRAASPAIADPLAQLTGREIQEALDRELNLLPDRLRVPLVLCCLEGLTRDEAANRLGWPVSLLKSRLEQARERLRSRLAARGLPLAGIFAASAAVPPVLLAATVQAAGGSATASLVAPRVAALTEGVLKAMFVTKLKKTLGWLLLGVVTLGVGLSAQRVLAEKPKPAEAPTLERGRGDGVRLPPQMLAQLGLQAAEVKPRPAVERVLRLPGSLALDPQRVFRVRARFGPCEGIEIGKPEGQDRPLRVGDRVRQGQVLAVVGSAEVGQKKHDLFSAIVQLKLDEALLERAEKAANAVPEFALLNARRNVEADHNAVARALNTLKTWGIPEDEIEAVRQEAREAAGKRKPDTEEMRKGRLERWPRVTLRAPAEGTIVERNLSPHEIVQDSAINLFQIANLDRLLFLAQASEADLPVLQALPVGKLRCTVQPGQFVGLRLAVPSSDAEFLRRIYLDLVGIIPGESEIRAFLDDRSPDKRARLIERLLASPEHARAVIEPVANTPVEGVIDEIGSAIDPNQHTAVVKGHIDNKKHQLRAGQFVVVTIALPPPAEVGLPSSALVEQGRDTFVFVQADPKKFVYEQRRVLVVRRGKDAVHVRTRLTPEEERQGLQTIRPGEQIITAGALELKAILDDLKMGPKRLAPHK